MVNRLYVAKHNLSSVRVITQQNFYTQINLGKNQPNPELQQPNHDPSPGYKVDMFFVIHQMDGELT
jgi:hypothetical protein